MYIFFVAQNQKKHFMLDPVLMPHEVVVLTIAASLQTLPLCSLFSFNELIIVIVIVENTNLYSHSLFSSVK